MMAGREAEAKKRQKRRKNKNKENNTAYQPSLVFFNEE
jgi:hypothetical protein